MSVPTDAEIRDAARQLAPELTTTLGAAESAVPAGVADRIEWARMFVHVDVLGSAARRLVGLGYLLAHRCTCDLSGSQGATSAPIGAGASAGAVTGTTVGQMSVQYGGAGAFSPIPARSLAEADLSSTAYGRAYLAMLAASPRSFVPFHA